MSIRPGRPGPVRAALRVAAAFAAVLAWSGARAAPIDDVRECAANGLPTTSGIKALAKECPQLEQALRDLGVERVLYDGWREKLNRQSLGDLVKLAERYAEPKPGAAPDIAALPGILKSLQHDKPLVSPSWWDLLRAWLSKHSDSLQWLDRWLERVGEAKTLFDVLSYALIGLILIAAAAVVLNELRASGSLRRSRRLLPAGTRKFDALGESSREQGGVAAPLAESLAALLRRLVARLIETRRLNAERSLTHRELVARGVFDSASQRAAFAAVARTAESLLYGSRPASPEKLERVLQEGEALLGQLADAPRPP